MVVAQRSSIPGLRATASGTILVASSSAGWVAMYQLLTSIASRDIALRQLPAFAAAFLIASFLYKFGSFALECVAFLVTWFVIDAALQFVTGREAG